ncbi:hypothetical protein JB92DRAFT_2852666 [Gautieria morchelliformis]|nr:hypothetical protein JB92DRAFT_2852666 [Gautieria morchelliformis]
MANDNPPSYDYATQDSGKATPPHSPVKGQIDKPYAHNQGVPPPPHTLQAGPSYAPRHDPTNVHHYVNPLTGEHVVSVLPPNHPEMVCLQEGRHIKQTRFGLLGVLAAIFWFPLGIGLCLLDRRVRCERCGYVLEDGFMCG